MEEKIISKEAFRDFLAGLTGKYQVFAPVRSESSIAFEEIDSGDEILFDYFNTKTSIKDFFFPQRERLFSFNLIKPEEIGEPDLSDRKRIIFGLRPCDAKGLSLLDSIFDDKDYQDPYYLTKRGDTIVISMGCNQPAGTCFCTSLGGDPFSDDGSDLFLVDMGDFLLARPVTEKGEALIKEETGFKKVDEDQSRIKEKIIEDARASIKSDVNPEKVKEKLDANFDDAIWDKLHEKCLGCGICTFLCPTCHCFDILDETGGSKGERIRIWDSCMFPQFTLHASGANPRPTGRERVRQRVMHKFKYLVDNTGKTGCTGCGRCIIYCPVNLDIREILREIENQ